MPTKEKKKGAHSNPSKTTRRALRCTAMDATGQRCGGQRNHVGSHLNPSGNWEAAVPRPGEVEKFVRIAALEQRVNALEKQLTRVEQVTRPTQMTFAADQLRQLLRLPPRTRLFVVTPEWMPHGGDLIELSDDVSLTAELPVKT